MQFTSSPVSTVLLYLKKFWMSFYLQAFGSFMKIFPLIFLGSIYVDSISNILAISGFIFYSIYCLVILMVLKMQLLLSNRIVKIIQSYLFFCFLLLLYVIEIYPRFSCRIQLRIRHIAYNNIHNFYIYINISFIK